jgi:conjugal transfer pilus assembly protein TraF
VMTRLSFFVLLNLFAVLSAFGEEVEPPVSHQYFYRGKEDGWFWYKDPIEIKKEEPKEIAPPPSKQPKVESVVNKKNEPEPFSVVWLRENLPKLQEAAIDNPTNDNVSAYMYAQRVAMDKAQNYAEKVRQVVAADVYLDENNRIPIASFAAAQFDRSLSKSKLAALKSIAEKGGIWVFFDSSCTFCGPQVNQVKEIAKRYGFITKFISTDKKGIPGLLNDGQWVSDTGQAKALKVTITPTTILVSPPNNFYVVSQGLMAQDALSDRLLVAAQTNNMLPQEILAGLQQYQRGVVKTEDMNEGASSDPKEWIQKLKDRLQGRY